MFELFKFALAVCGIDPHIIVVIIGVLGAGWESQVKWKFLVLKRSLTSSWLGNQSIWRQKSPSLHFAKLWNSAKADILTGRREGESRWGMQPIANYVTLPYVRQGEKEREGEGEQVVIKTGYLDIVGTGSDYLWAQLVRNRVSGAV